MPCRTVMTSDGYRRSGWLSAECLPGYRGIVGRLPVVRGPSGHPRGTQGAPLPGLSLGVFPLRGLHDAAYLLACVPGCLGDVLL
jgi:hypothetical protein